MCVPENCNHVLESDGYEGRVAGLNFAKRSSVRATWYLIHAL